MSECAKPTDELPLPAADQAGAEAESTLPWRRILLLAVVAGVFLGVVYLSPLREYLNRMQEVSKSIRDFGPLAPLVLTLSVAVLVAIGFPRLLFCVIAGMALGFWSGLLWTQLGTLLGNYAVFSLARHGGGDWARRYLSKRGRLHNLVHREGIPGVILARQLPMPGLIINLVCGLFPIRQRDYLFGTILGQLPEAVPCTLIGAGVIKASLKQSIGAIGLAVVFTVAVWLGFRWFLRRKVSKDSGLQTEGQP
jgi:uncharacterized membrane protein YdjX (TVP38/TMEM64 family)